MSPVKVVIGVLGVVALFAGVLLLERVPRGKPLEMQKVEVARAEGLEVPVPESYLLIVDDRFNIPPGAIALGREGKGGDRATIMVAPYPADGEELLTRNGCETVAKVHAKQVGAQLDDATLGGKGRERACRATLSEGKGIVGRMILRRTGSDFVMVTCRYARKNGADAKACQDVAASLP